MKINDYDAVANALMFAENNLKDFHEFLRDQGRFPTVKYTTKERLNFLKSKFFMLWNEKKANNNPILEQAKNYPVEVQLKGSIALLGTKLHIKAGETAYAIRATNIPERDKRQYFVRKENWNPGDSILVTEDDLKFIES